MTSEKITDSQRRLLEEVFQCESGKLHVSEGCHLEIVADGKIAQAGQMGEVVLTFLHQYGMPFVRYKITDTEIYTPGSSENRALWRNFIPILPPIWVRVGWGRRYDQGRGRRLCLSVL